jgi:uncharacterized membrane protein
VTLDRWLGRISLWFAGLGGLVSIYMTVFKLTENQSMCLGNGGCSVVNNSIYAEVYGIPVSVIGIIGYGALVGALLLQHRGAFMEDNSLLIIFGLALVGFLFTAYLIYVEIALIHALCPFCITSQISMTVVFVLSVIRLLREPQN